jgi:hypothetical protein
MEIDETGDHWLMSKPIFSIMLLTIVSAENCVL